MAALIFWFAFLALAFSYLGYPISLALLTVFRRREERAERPLGGDLHVSVILAVRNERHRVAGRLKNLLEQDYPEDALEVVVASDGSTDGTDDLLRSIAASEMRVTFVSSPGRGKAEAINSAVDRARGEILVFADARQEYAPGAIRRMLTAFQDPKMGAASGRLQVKTGVSSDGIGIAAYVKLEYWVRRTEAKSGSTIGVTGAIYAARRTAFPRLPVGTILDDVYVPMHMLLHGWRVGYVGSAVAYDLESTTFREEFWRKVRTLTGVYQLFGLLPGVLDPRRNPAFIRFVSHKLVRLAGPVLIILLFASNWILSGLLYSVTLLGQSVFYGLGVVGLVWRRSRRLVPFRVPAAFLVLNAAAAVALVNAIRGERDVWVDRSPAGRAVHGPSGSDLSAR